MCFWCCLSAPEHQNQSAGGFLAGVSIDTAFTSLRVSLPGAPFVPASAASKRLLLLLVLLSELGMASTTALIVTVQLHGHPSFARHDKRVLRCLLSHNMNTSLGLRAGNLLTTALLVAV